MLRHSVVLCATGLLALASGLPRPATAQGETHSDPWLGVGISCTQCGSRQMPGGSVVWTFSTPPQIIGIDSGGPAAQAGLRIGDILTHVNGVPLASADGGRRFGNLAVGQTVTWTYQRAGSERSARMTVQPKPTASVVEPTTGATPVRFSGNMRDVDVEVRGDNVSVTVDESTGEMIIRGTDVRVRLRPRPARPSRGPGT